LASWRLCVERHFDPCHPCNKCFQSFGCGWPRCAFCAFLRQSLLSSIPPRGRACPGNFRPSTRHSACDLTAPYGS
jgi:hypothetical protein